VLLPKSQDLTIQVQHPTLIAPRWERIDYWSVTNGGHVFPGRAAGAGLKPQEEPWTRKTGKGLPGVTVGLSTVEARQIIQYGLSDDTGAMRSKSRGRGQAPGHERPRLLGGAGAKCDREIGNRPAGAGTGPAVG